MHTLKGGEPNAKFLLTSRRSHLLTYGELGFVDANETHNKVTLKGDRPEPDYFPQTKSAE